MGTPELDPDAEPWRFRERIAALLIELADATGDGRCARAAGILAGKRIGRRPVDDDKALDLVHSLLAAGLAKSRHAACRRVAHLTAPPHAIEATIGRLMRKSSDTSFKFNDTRVDAP